MKHFKSILVVALLASIGLFSCKQKQPKTCNGKEFCTKEFITFNVDVINDSGQLAIVDEIKVIDVQNKTIRTAVPIGFNPSNIAFSGDVDFEILKPEDQIFKLQAIRAGAIVATKNVILKRDCCHAIWTNMDTKFIIP